MLLGLTGGLSAGKSEAADYLAKKHGFTVHSFSDVLREEATRRDIEPTRENLQNLGIALRKETNNDAIIAEKLIFLIRGNTVVDGIRNTAEIRALKVHPSFFLLAIDAPAHIRFDRLIKRKRPGDPKTMVAFIENDEREFMETNPAFEISACMKLADKIISNHTTRRHLYSELDAAIVTFSTR